ncbi:hypothetical protein NONO_c73820 [Nocardia nova SH22a]|uniref:SecA family profile domain-containing protein n=1 Tax=Nocardia nova SH22a TaxID=1415166 RepID=W5TS73_9NOCA|nr:hypothetical protein [Nocardia nova]AHH22137.1 hypothetical protein NONO_c73820 [Nocardia nova SH22a]
MDDSLFSRVVELRNTFESLPDMVRRPIEMVVFGGELPRADISALRRMAAELRAHCEELDGQSRDIKALLAQEDSVGELANQLLKALHSYEKGAAQLGGDVGTLADQAQAAANDAEKWLCVMFTFGIQLAWRIFSMVTSAMATGPAGVTAAAPTVDIMLVEGRGEVTAMRAALVGAIEEGAAKAAARLTAPGALRFATMLAKAAALPAAVDAGVQALQVATGDRTADIIGSDGSNPTGIDLKSIEVAALSGAGGAVGGMVAGKFAPMVFPRIGSSRLAMGLVHGTVGAISGLGAASLVAGWPQHYDQMLAPLLNGAFAGGVYSRSGAPTRTVDGGPFTPPDAFSAGHDAQAATPRRPVAVSAESKRVWEDAQKAWGPTAETTKTTGERGAARAEVEVETPAAEPHSRGEQGASVAPDRAGGRWPGEQARPASSDAAAARSGAHSETAAPVDRSSADKPVAAGKTTAPRSVDAVGETSPPPKLPAGTAPRPVGEVHEKTGVPSEHRPPQKTAHIPSGEHVAVADRAGNETSARPHPVAEGEAGSSGAREEHKSSGSEDRATAQRDSTAEPPGQESHEGSGRTEADGAETPAADQHSLSARDELSAAAADHDNLAEAAGVPRSARDMAVDLLIDFNQANADHVPENQRLSNLSDEALTAGLHGGDEHQSLLATMEIIRRGTISEKVPGGMVLRVEQAEAFYAMKSRPVEMKPGEGKSLVFMTAAIQRAVRHDSVLLVTTTDGLANREAVTYRKLLTGDDTEFADTHNLLSKYGIDVFRADQGEAGFGPITKGRPAIVVATGETVGHLCNAGKEPPRHALIDEMDGIIDRGEKQFLRSEGVEDPAPPETATEVFGAHDFLMKALADGTLSHEDFGLRRIAEHIDVHADGTPEYMYWYDGQPELTPGGRAKVEALPDGARWLEGMGASRLEAAAQGEFLVRNGVHYRMGAGKIVIIDQAEHSPQRNPKTSSESRWSAEPGKASLAQAIEAKEFRAAEARNESAEQHRVVVRADPTSAARIDSVQIYRVGRFFDEVTGASGTLTDLNPVLEKIYGLQEVHEVPRSRTQRLVEGQPDVVESTYLKLRTIAEYANEVRADGEGRFQQIQCHRDDLVARQVKALERAGVPREAIEAVDTERIIGWGADWEAQLQKVFDSAGEQGKILVINGQGRRGVDMSMSDAVKSKGGMHVWMTEAPEQSYIYEQGKNRTARNGERGSSQVVMSPQDGLIRNAMHLRGVRETVVLYETAVAAHTADPTPHNHEAVLAARQAVRDLVPELQQRALRHATAEFIRHHAGSTGNLTLTLAEADTGLYDQPDFTRPDEPTDQAARLAGLLGIPAPAVANQITELERNGATDPVHELLNRAGIAPATAEALRQHVGATAPAKARERAGLSDVDALIEMMPLRNRLADERGVPIADISGAEGMRVLDPLLTEARDALSAALGYPTASITPVIARDILGEVVADHLTATNTGQFAVGNDIDSAAAVSGPMSLDAENADTTDVTAAADADIVAAASQYLSTAALLDLVVQIHRRSPNSCVSNAVTGMRVLCPNNARRFEMPATRLRGHGRDVVREVFGAGLEKAESLEQVAESLKSRPGGISVLVYKWKDTRATGSADADDYMVLLVNDSDTVGEPNLVVVDLAVSRDGDTANDYGPKDLRNRRTLLNKAVGLDEWRREQKKFTDRMPVEKRLFETIEFDRDGNLVARRDAPAAETLPPPQRTSVPQALVDEINAAGAAQPVGSRPSENAADPPPSTPTQYTVREAGTVAGRYDTGAAGPASETPWRRRRSAAAHRTEKPAGTMPHALGKRETNPVRSRLDEHLTHSNIEEAVAVLRKEFAHKVFPWVRHNTQSPEVAREIFETACRRAIRDIGRIGDQDLEQWLVVNARELVSQHGAGTLSVATEPGRSAAAQPEVSTADLVAALRRSRIVQHLPPVVRVALGRDRETLQAVIDELAAGPRRLLELRFGLGMSVERTAEALGRTEGAVRTAQRGAFLRIARLLEERAGNQPFEVVLEALVHDLDAFTRCLTQLGPEQRAAVEGRLLRNVPTQELVKAYGPNHYATYYRAVRRLSGLLLDDVQARPGVVADRELVQRTSVPRAQAATAAQTGLPAFEMREIRANRAVAAHLRAGAPARRLPDFHPIPDPDSDLFGDLGTPARSGWLEARKASVALPVVNVTGGGHGRRKVDNEERLPEPRSSSLWRLLRNRPDIALRSSGQIGSELGTLLMESMMPYYVLSTAGPDAASWVRLIGTLPYLGGPIIAGIVAEHKPARPTMAAGEGLVILGTATQIFAITTGVGAVPLTMSLATAAMSAGAIFYGQASSKVFREMFGEENDEEFARFNNLQGYLPRIITGFGPMVATTAPLLAPVVNGISSAWNLATMRGMPTTSTTPLPSGKDLGNQVLKSAGEGFRALRRHILDITVNHLLTNFALGGESIYLSLEISNSPMPEWQKFAILTAMPLGSLLGGRIPTKLREKLDINTVLTAHIAGMAGVGLAEALTDNVAAVAPFWVAAWATLGAGNVSVGKYRNQKIPGDVYARASSVYEMVGRLASPLGGLAVGAGLLNLGMGPAQWISAGALTALTSGLVIRNVAKRRAAEPVAPPGLEVIRNCAIQVARVHRALGYDTGPEPDSADRRWNANDNWRITEESLGNQLRPFDTSGRSPVHEAAEIIANPKNKIDSAAVVVDGHIHYVVAVEGENGTETLIFDTLVEDADTVHVRNISGDENGENAWTASYDEFGNAFAAFWTSANGRPEPVGMGRGRLLQPTWFSNNGNLEPAFRPIMALRHRTHPVKLLGSLATEHDGHFEDLDPKEPIYVQANEELIAEFPALRHVLAPSDYRALGSDRGVVMPREVADALHDMAVRYGQRLEGTYKTVHLFSRYAILTEKDSSAIKRDLSVWPEIELHATSTRVAERMAVPPRVLLPRVLHIERDAQGKILWVIQERMEGSPVKGFDAHDIVPAIKEYRRILRAIPVMRKRELEVAEQAPPGVLLIPEDHPESGDTEGFYRMLMDHTEKVYQHYNNPEDPAMEPYRAMFRELHFPRSITEGLDPFIEDLRSSPFYVLSGDITKENVWRTHRGMVIGDPLGIYGPEAYESAVTMHRSPGNRSSLDTPITRETAAFLALLDVARALNDTLNLVQEAMSPEPDYDKLYDAARYINSGLGNANLAWGVGVTFPASPDEIARSALLQRVLRDVRAVVSDDKLANTIAAEAFARMDSTPGAVIAYALDLAANRSSETTDAERKGTSTPAPTPWQSRGGGLSTPDGGVEHFVPNPGLDELCAPSAKRTRRGAMPMHGEIPEGAIAFHHRPGGTPWSGNPQRRQKEPEPQHSGTGPGHHADNDSQLPATPPADLPSYDAETARGIKRALAWEIFDTYHIDVLGLEKLSVAGALTVRNAIIDQYDEIFELYKHGITLDSSLAERKPLLEALRAPSSFRIDVLAVASIHSNLDGLATQLKIVPDLRLFILNEVFFKERYGQESFAAADNGFIHHPTGNALYTAVRHEIAHLMDPKGRSDDRQQKLESFEAKAFGYLLTYFDCLKNTERSRQNGELGHWTENDSKILGEFPSIPADTSFEDWLNQLDGYSRIKKTTHPNDPLYEAFRHWLNQPKNKPGFDIDMSELDRTYPNGDIPLPEVFARWWEKISVDPSQQALLLTDLSRHKQATRSQNSEPPPRFGSREVFNPIEALAEANLAFGRSAPADFTDPAYALQALLRGLSPVEVWRDAARRNEVARRRAADHGAIPAPSKSHPVVAADGPAARLARAWRASPEPDQQAIRAEPGSFQVPPGKPFVYDELARLVDRQRGLWLGVEPDAVVTAGEQSAAQFVEHHHVPTGELAQQIQKMGDLARERMHRLESIHDALTTPGISDMLGLGEWARAGATGAELDLPLLRQRIDDMVARGAEHDFEMAPILSTTNIDAVARIEADLRQAKARAEELAITAITKSPDGIRYNDHKFRTELLTRADDYDRAAEFPLVLLQVDLSGRILIEQ